jgi:hypothetical protein
MEKELHFSVCSVPSAFLLQSRRDDPKSAQGGAHVSETSVRATLGCEECPQRNPAGVALREGGNDGSIICQGDRSFRLQFRAAPSGLWISVATLPRVARTLAELAFAGAPSLLGRLGWHRAVPSAREIAMCFHQRNTRTTCRMQHSPSQSRQRCLPGGATHRPVNGYRGGLCPCCRVSRLERSRRPCRIPESIREPFERLATGS